MDRPKVLGIGFHKTGTTSLARALEHLAYRVAGPNGVRDPNIGENVYRMAYALVEEYDAFHDNPWPVLYGQLDRGYPGSRFIIPLRPTDASIESVVRHFGESTTQ